MSEYEINRRIVSVFDWQKKIYGYGTQQQFASAIGLSLTTMNEIFNNKKGAGYNVIYGILKTFVEIDARWLITGEGSMLTSDVRVSQDEFDKIRDDLKYHKDLLKDLMQIAKGGRTNP